MTDASTLDWTVFVLVVTLRLVVPLFIPRFPLPAILAALVIDGIDQTVFATFTDLSLENYQSYDKALDIYYLTVAYLSVLRNWRNPFAVGVAAFLWYYRLVGVLLFVPWPGTLAAVLPIPYAISAAQFWSVRDDDCERANAGWRRFLWLNLVTGFLVTMLLIVIARAA